MQEKDPEKGMLVRKIEEGTVVDHIPDWKAQTVSKVLRLDKLARMQSEISVAILQNVDSKTLARKDVIKIDRWHVDEKEADILSLIFPGITVNYINEWKVSKYSSKVPDTIEGRIKCPEVNCISNSGREPVVSKFVTLKRDRLLQCHYCDTTVEFERIPDLVSA
ncbi:MAG: aspartate carbamoyltransferase regulatory subunit [Thaumarchaeota archaeon]|nr:aspartate carbamoyltransferase regulatory subunit [Nitrososphaerota archaeon]